MKKNGFTTVGQMKKHVQEVGVSVSKLTIKRRLHLSKYRGCTARCEPQKQEGQIRDCQKHLLKSPNSSGTTAYGQTRQRTTCSRMMGRKEDGEVEGAEA